MSEKTILDLQDKKLQNKTRPTAKLYYAFQRYL